MEIQVSGSISFLQPLTKAMESLTHDSISLRGSGVITISQEKEGHRFTLDSLLLADFCRVKPEDAILEPGAGTGIITILLAKKFPASAIVAVEAQRTEAELCRKNISDNGLDDRVLLLEKDIKSLKSVLKVSTFDVIVANPPYMKVGAGRKSSNQGRILSRHEVLGDLRAWLDLQVFLKNKGRYALVFPAERLGELVTSLRSRKLEPKSIRFVHPYADRPASLVLVEAVKASGIGLEVLPPLIVHESGGHFSEEMRSIYDLR